MVLLVRGVFLCVQVRGVRDSPGCLSRAVFIWRTPNNIDEHFSPWKASSPAIEFESCLKEALNRTAYPQVDGMNVLELEELKLICKEIKFNSVCTSIVFLTLNEISVNVWLVYRLDHK